MGQAKIRHIAICTDDTVKLSSFYKDTFGMTEVMAREPGNPEKAVYLSDGYINLAILPTRESGRVGIDHFGFQVENVEETGRVGKDSGAQTGIAPRPRDGRYAEFRIHDPVGTGIDLAQAGWATAPEPAEVVAGRVNDR